MIFWFDNNLRPLCYRKTIRNAFTKGLQMSNYLKSSDRPSFYYTKYASSLMRSFLKNSNLSSNPTATYTLQFAQDKERCCFAPFKEFGLRNPGSFCLWALKSGTQLKESRIPLGSPYMERNRLTLLVRFDKKKRPRTRFNFVKYLLKLALILTI